jgi:hypothetical protein
MSFFPDGKQIAVTTGSYILFFDPKIFQHDFKVPGIRQGSNIVFKADLSAAYVSAPNESRVRMLGCPRDPGESGARGTLDVY